MFKHFFNAAQARFFLRMQALFALLAVLMSVATWYGANAVPLEGLPGLVVKGIIAAVISGGITLAIFHSDINVVTEFILKKNKEALFQ